MNIFIHLPVRDMKRSVEFYSRLGYGIDPQCTDARQTCLMVGDGSFLVLVPERCFDAITGRPPCDGLRRSDVLLSVSCDSRAEVDARLAGALAAGGAALPAVLDDGHVYRRSFVDPDGHAWALVHMRHLAPTIGDTGLAASNGPRRAPADALP